MELGRQRDEIELIASENIVSQAVLEAQGSVLTNKYAEGLPGRRYYGGCQYVDIAEKLAIERVTKLFGCNFANVQPHSGASANAAAFMALMEPGDTFLGLNLAAGGHLTHGSPVNMSGKWFKPVPYSVRRDDHRIDMDEVRKARARASAQGDHRGRLGLSAHHRLPRLPRDRRRGRRLPDGRHGAFCRPRRRRRRIPTPFPHAHVVTSTAHKTLRGPRSGFILTDDEALAKKINSAVFPGLQGGPLMHVIAAKAVAFGEALRPSFKLYAKNVVENAKALAETLKSKGLDIVSGGTDTHLMLVDLRPKRLTGKVAEAGARTRPHHLQQERHSLRPGKADHHLGRPARHARRHHARLRHRRIPAGRRTDRARCSTCSRRRASRRMRWSRPRCANRSRRWCSGFRFTRDERATRATAEAGRAMRCPNCAASTRR